MARKPAGRTTGRTKTTIDWQKFEFDCQIHATKEEICKCLNISETTLDAEYNAHYHEIVLREIKILTKFGFNIIGSIPPLKRTPSQS